MAFIAAFAGGCGNPFENHLGSYLSGKPFPVGNAERYRPPGVYDDHLKAHRIWIVSFAGMVVALSADCPLDDEPLYYDKVSDQFKCTRCDGRFDSNGLPRAPGGTRQSMVRFRIQPVNKQAVGKEVELQVNRKFEFRQEKNQWSNQFSLYVFDAAS